MKKLGIILVCVISCGCQTGPSGVVDKVLVDFGIRDRPEGYVSASDKVFERLQAVGQTDMKRMNTEGRHGEVKFQDEDRLHGKYYKEVKRYEKFQPLEARPTSKGARGERGYVGYITYAYRLYQSPRKSNRTEAAATSATVRTDITGRETYRYKFGTGGAWNGRPGERTRR